MADMTPPTKYLTAANLQNQDATGVIASVLKEEVGNPPEELYVVRFQGWEKGLTLNVTNTNAIIDQYGADGDKWIGKEITLFPTTTDYQGRQVACIRVRPAQAATQAPLDTNQQSAGDALGNVIDERNPPQNL